MADCGFIVDLRICLLRIYCRVSCRQIMFNKSAIRIPQSAMTCAVVAFTASAVIVASQERMPRTPDGRPDLQGIYDLATLTPLERRAGTPLVLTSEETARLETD